MAMTELEKAKRTLMAKYGPKVYVEDHGSFKRVGYRIDGKKIYATGPTWEAAIDALERKAGK